jgi:hypothetical protein
MGGLGSLSINLSGAIPDSVTTFGGTGAILSYAMPVPSDLKTASVGLANRTGTGNGAGNSFVSNVAIYQSDGTGLPTGTAFASYSNQTIPGDGTEVTLGPFPVTRGIDGNIVVVYSVPASINICQAQYQNWGAYILGTATVTPAPTGWNPNYVLGLLQIVLKGKTAKRVISVIGDSISVGAAPGGATPVGFTNSAWNLIGTAKGYAMSIFGMSGSTLAEFAAPVTYPALWIDQTNAGSDGYIEAGINDLASQTAAQMEASFTAIVTKARAVGYKRIYANTITPSLVYVSNDAVRVAYNTWLRGLPLGITGVVDLAAAQSAGGMADNTTPSVLFAAYDAGDGTHWSAAGHSRAATAIEAVIG